MPGVRDGVGVAEHLAGDPILAVAAVEIATEHAERQRVGAGQDVEERLLLDRVAGEGADVAVGDEERAVVVEPDAADAVAAGLDEAAVAAGEALDVAVVAVLDRALRRPGRCGGGGCP